MESKQKTLFTLTEDEATKYLSGQLQLPDDLLKPLQPVLRVTYHRITFATNGVETYLDTDITFHQASNLYHLPQATLGPHNLEMASGCRPVPKFSKYLHGISHFHEMPLVPYWLSFEQQASTQQPVRIQLADESEPLLPQEKLLAQKIPDQDLEANNNKVEIKVKLDSKTFFSNERTFISWLQFSALLLSASVNLLNFGDSTSRIAGGVFVGIAGGVALYSLYRFERRAWYIYIYIIIGEIMTKKMIVRMIGHRSIGRYEDLWGPAALCVILVCALIVSDSIFCIYIN